MPSTARSIRSPSESASELTAAPGRSSVTPTRPATGLDPVAGDAKSDPRPSAAATRRPDAARHHADTISRHRKPGRSSAARASLDCASARAPEPDPYRATWGLLRHRGEYPIAVNPFERPSRRTRVKSGQATCFPYPSEGRGPCPDSPTDRPRHFPRPALPLQPRGGATARSGGVADALDGGPRAARRPGEWPAAVLAEGAEPVLLADDRSDIGAVEAEQAFQRHRPTVAPRFSISRAASTALRFCWRVLPRKRTTEQRPSPRRVRPRKQAQRPPGKIRIAVSAQAEHHRPGFHLMLGDTDSGRAIPRRIVSRIDQSQIRSRAKAILVLGGLFLGRAEALSRLKSAGQHVIDDKQEEIYIVRVARGEGLQ